MNKNLKNIIKTGLVAGVNSIFELFFLYVLGLYLSSIVGNGSKIVSNVQGLDKFTYLINEYLVGIFIFTILLRVSIQIFSLNYISNKIGLIISNVRKLLFDEIVEQDINIKFTYILDNNINKINSLTVNFIPALVNVISEFILLLILLCGFTYITQEYVAFLLIPLSLYPLYKSAVKSSSLGNGRRLLEDKFLSLYDYLFHSRIEILSIGKINNIKRIYKNLSNEAIKQISKHYIFTQGPRIIIEFFVSLLLLMIGLFHISTDNNLIVLLIALRIFPVLTRINGFLNQISYSLRIVGQSFLLKYLFSNYSKQEIKDKDTQLINRIIINKGEIKYKNITIKNINQIEFIKGKINFILGRSGVGKTSLIYSLLGYGNYKISNGILVDGINFEDMSSFKVGLYFNGGNKLIDDVIDYLTYYDDSPQQKLISHLMENSNIKNLMELDPGARKLSSGELQRLDFVRLLYNKSCIYILDEPTSNLDHESFKVVETQLKLLSLENLVIVVTHDNRFNLEDAVDLI